MDYSDCKTASAILLRARDALIQEQIKALETPEYYGLYDAWKIVMNAIKYVEKQD